MLSPVTKLAAKLCRESVRLGGWCSTAPALGALALGLASCSGSESEPIPPKHVVLVTVDTLSATRMSSFGHSRATTDLAGVAASATGRSESRRSLDQLASEGVMFARAFAPRGMTFPSMATYFTGRPPLEHGAIDNGNLLCEAVPTMAESFQRAGFETAAFTANPLLAVGSGIERGFDKFESYRTPERDLSVVQSATAWLLERDLESGAPVFLWLHLMGPHMPYDPGPLEGVDYRALFTNPSFNGRANGSREFLDKAYEDALELDPRAIEHVRALYDGEVARVDHLIALFVEILSGAIPEQPVDMLEDSLFIFASDHGEELHTRNHYWAHSKSLYDPVLHVPLFIRHPNSAPGERVMGELVELQDLMPTVLEWFSLPLPNGMRGRSLVPLLRGEEFESRPVVAVWKDRIFSIRTDEWRYVWNPDLIEPTDPPAGAYPIPLRALYDAQGDRNQVYDVLSSNPEVGADLERQLVEWLDALRPICTADGVISEERMQILDDLGYSGAREIEEPLPKGEEDE